jgi:hypothetical protein
MARTDDPDSADSQFFICLVSLPHLDGQYTVWGASSPAWNSSIASSGATRTTAP